MPYEQWLARQKKAGKFKRKKAGPMRPKAKVRKPVMSKSSGY
jgi:hypothetical protein